MQRDVEQWNSNQLSDAERLMLTRNFGFFATAESLAANNIVLGTYRCVTAPECRAYLLRQAFEEAVHVESYLYIAQSLGLDEGEIFNAYREINSIYEKDSFCLKAISPLEDPAFRTGDLESDTKLLKAILVFALILEGLFFYTGFAQILALGRRGLMQGCTTMVGYILRDESLHLSFGADMANTIIQENPHLWTKEVQTWFGEAMERAVRLEEEFARQSMSQSMVGINLREYVRFIHFVAQKRLAMVGLKWTAKPVQNPFPWLAESVEIQKEQNFFEAPAVTEYAKKPLEW